MQGRLNLPSLVLKLFFLIAPLAAIQSSSAQIGWTWEKCQSAYGTKPFTWWHRDDSSYVQYQTPFWMLGLYFNRDLTKDDKAIVVKASFMTISIAEAGGFRPVAISEIESLMEKNSLGHTWSEQEYLVKLSNGKQLVGFVTDHKHGEEFLVASPMGFNGSGYYSGVEINYFPVQ